MKKIFLICVFIVLVFVIIFYKSNNILNDKSKFLIITNTNNCDKEINLYYSNKENKIYSYCLNSIKIKVDNNYIELKDYLKNNDFDLTINKISNDKGLWNDSIIYKDGGSTKYSNSKITLIKCKTIEGNHDIYIGTNSMKFESSFCK